MMEVDLALFRDSAENIKHDIKRRFSWRQYHETTNAVFPLSMRRLYSDGSEHSHPSLGTGFLYFSYEHRATFLISNYHCLSGRDLYNSTIGSFIPNIIDVGITINEPTDDPKYFTRKEATLRYPLLDEDEEPLYFHFPPDASGRIEADIAILPISIEDNAVKDRGAYFNTRYISSMGLYLDHDLSLGEDCFIIGYPRGLSGDGRTPIWKRATIASEPNNTYKGDLVFLVDTATREGMSGSPVFLVRRESVLSDQNRRGIDEEKTEKLIGVYSGRMGTDELGVQLGMVWSVEMLRLLTTHLPIPTVVNLPAAVIYEAK
jgi:hypothetical protein